MRGEASHRCANSRRSSGDPPPGLTAFTTVVAALHIFCSSDVNMATPCGHVTAVVRDGPSRVLGSASAAMVPPAACTAPLPPLPLRPMVPVPLPLLLLLLLLLPPLLLLP